MKTTPIFYFVDEPQFATKESRAYIANSLRAFRNKAEHKGRYILKRLQPHTYMVSTGDHSAKAIIITHGT